MLVDVQKGVLADVVSAGFSAVVVLPPGEDGAEDTANVVVVELSGVVVSSESG